MQRLSIVVVFALLGLLGSPGPAAALHHSTDGSATTAAAASQTLAPLAYDSATDLIQALTRRLVGSTYGYDEARSPVFTRGHSLPSILAAKSVPNPYGRLGSPAHRARIQEAEDRFADKGWQTVSGGSRPEAKYGSRYPDLVMEKDGQTIAIQVGRKTRSGMPVARERRALDDLRGTGEFDHVFFVGYTP